MDHSPPLDHSQVKQEVDHSQVYQDQDQDPEVDLKEELNNHQEVDLDLDQDQDQEVSHLPDLNLASYLQLAKELKHSHLSEVHLQLELEEHKLSLAWQPMMLLVPQEEEHSKAKLLLTQLN